MTVVYADSVFLLNMAMDYVLFLGTARLAGLTLQRKRYVLAALLGGAYAAAVFLPGLEFMGAPSVKIAAGILLSLVAFGGEKKLLRLILILFGISCAMAGGVLGLSLVAGGSVPMAGGIFFTDVNGITTEFEVIAREILSPDAIEDMTAGEFDLTLFTCTYGGASRITVRCDRKVPN